MKPSSTHLANLDQADAAYRDAAEFLAALKKRLEDVGFTEEAAETMTAIYFEETLNHAH